MMTALALPSQHSMHAPRQWHSSCCVKPSAPRLQCFSMPTRSTPFMLRTPSAPLLGPFSSVQAGCPAFRSSAVRIHLPTIALQFHAICGTSLPHNPHRFGICVTLTGDGWCARNAAVVSPRNPSLVLLSRSNISLFQTNQDPLFSPLHDEIRSSLNLGQVLAGREDEPSMPVLFAISPRILALRNASALPANVSFSGASVLRWLAALSRAVIHFQHYRIIFLCLLPGCWFESDAAPRALQANTRDFFEVHSSNPPVFVTLGYVFVCRIQYSLRFADEMNFRFIIPYSRTPSTMVQVNASRP
jgi:hypothetical protein